MTLLTSARKNSVYQSMAAVASWTQMYGVMTCVMVLFLSLMSFVVTSVVCTQSGGSRSLPPARSNRVGRRPAAASRAALHPAPEASGELHVDGFVDPGKLGQLVEGVVNVAHSEPPSLRS